jgi:hypothetical protein
VFRPSDRFGQPPSDGSVLLLTAPALPQAGVDQGGKEASAEQRDTKQESVFEHAVVLGGWLSTETRWRRCL